ncbi:MAG: thioredoxin [Bacteroidales bacterium]|jgi:thioredoxin 1|nr:thioredoxin [Bacteroidales bacterium]
MALVIDENNFEEVVLKSDKPVLVDFWAEWCSPCRSIAPFVEQLASEYEGKAVVGKVDVDQNNAIATQYNILSIPTLLYFKDGKLADKQVGLTNKAVLAGKLDALLP